MLIARRKRGWLHERDCASQEPADIPVQQSTKAKLIINFKTAKALGITVPISLLGQADEVIEEGPANWRMRHLFRAETRSLEQTKSTPALDLIAKQKRCQAV
jgi:hypothetical protein